LSAFATRIASSSALATAWNRVGVFLLGVLGGQERNLRQRAAKELAAIGNDMRARQFQAAIGEGLHADVRRDCRLAITGQRGDRVGVAQRHRQVVEAMRVAPQLRGRHLQHHGVEGQAHGGHGNAILLAKIGQRLDAGVDGVERHGAIADGADRLDLVGAAARALPPVSKDGKAAVP
jgi:hypothetical protein